MSNVVLLQVGQCGNQLGQEILNLLNAHNATAQFQERKASSKLFLEEDEIRSDESMNILFRVGRGGSSANSAGSTVRWTARAVCVDTEPKVINSCLEATKLQFGTAKTLKRVSSERTSNDFGWGYDMRNVAYRHGGAGNNWALGYQMAGSDPSKEGHHSSAAEGREASNEFLQTIIDGCLRREIEHCDEPAALCTIHSLAGGTGSGLGARLTEELSDVMADVTRLNIAIGPYHMGEVVVQHYNAVLSLSSLAQSSDGVLLFENETAQALCRQMSGIERPLLADVNRTIAGNLLPVFLPRCSLRTQAGQGKGEDRNGSGRQGQGQGQWQGQARRSGLLDDVIQLCGHPGYRFLDVKLTPQTSREAVLHTYDSYGTLFKTLAAMQMSGSASERLIASAFKHSSSAATSSPLGQGRGVGLGQGALKSAATSLCFHGDGGREAALDLVQQIMQMQVRPSSQSTAAPSPSLPSAPSSSSSRMSMSPPPLPRPQHQYHHLHQQQQPPFPLLAEYLASHSTLLGQTDQVTVQFSGGEQRVNGYHRSASLLSNSQAVLPLLQRSASKAEDLFLRGAYVHQYTSHGMELDDFVEAFRTLGAVIHNYSAL